VSKARREENLRRQREKADALKLARRVKNRGGRTTVDDDADLLMAMSGGNRRASFGWFGRRRP
jgi:hypothetical protein